MRKKRAAKAESMTIDRVEETREEVVSDVVESTSERSWPRVFRVRCAAPTLRGYSVRGVVIPLGGEVEIIADEADFRGFKGDPAIVWEEIG